MTQIAALNRNRTNWLWAFSFVLLLLPLTLGQSSAGGCGATVTVPNPDPNPDPGPDETIVDSDGDGFTDEEELSGDQATDPGDPTDNPDNVRDSDSDGCSDYDERNFAGFCDGNPNTTEVGPLTCNVTYYNEEFGFGFDLPASATPTAQNPDALFAVQWQTTLDGSSVAATVASSVTATSQPLSEIVNDIITEENSLDCTVS